MRMRSDQEYGVHPLSIRKVSLAIAITTAAASSGCSGNRDQPEEVACKRQDVVEAITQEIQQKAINFIYDDYIWPPSGLDIKPFSDYSTQLKSVPISLRDIETTSLQRPRWTFNGRWVLNCRAALRIGIPKQAEEVLKKVQQQRQRVLDADGKFGNESVELEDFTFTATEIDGNSIKAAFRKSYSAPFSLRAIAIAAANSEELLLENALNEYKSADIELNEFWSGMPKSIQYGALPSQRKWIAMKASKCGNGDYLSDNSQRASDRIRSIECHTRMTRDRIHELDM